MSRTYSIRIYRFSYRACNVHEPYAIFVCGFSGFIIFYHIISSTSRNSFL